jgi:nitric oxide reductase NorQ protein
MTKDEFFSRFSISAEPNYISQGRERELFAAAFSASIPLILKGPTGCGKTRFIEAMAYACGLPLVTVSCHEDLTAGDLVGRFLFKDNETVWQDGPLTLAVRYGGICYLDEIVEARKDTTVIIHSLSDDRRRLYIDKTGEVLTADPRFIMILSYNPGYQSVVKELKHSTLQRFAALRFDHPDVETESEIIRSESGVSRETAGSLAEMGSKLRGLRDYGLQEGVSSRLLVYAGRLMRAGLEPYEACRQAITDVVAEDEEVRSSVDNVIRLYFGELLSQST